jgi:DNA-binding SARP family transcriptional activator
MFLAKSAIPNEDLQFFNSEALERAAKFPFTLIAAPAGYLLTGRLPQVLAGQKDSTIWLRLGPEDRDPANLLLSLISACQGFNQQMGMDTLSRMQRYPGCLYGWPPLFERLAGEMSGTLPRSCALVLENVHQLAETQSTLPLMVSHFLNQLPESICRVLISHTEYPTGVIAHPANSIGVRDLRIPANYDLQLEETGWALPPKEDVRRVLHLSQGRPEVLLGVLNICEQVGHQLIHKILRQAKTQDQMLTQLVWSCLQIADPGELPALAITLRLGYFQIGRFEELTGKIAPADGPWLQRLSGQWYRTREVWRPALDAALRHFLDTQGSLLRGAADVLTGTGDVEMAVPIYLQLRDYKSAVRAMEMHIASLMNLGQWETLNGWLGQLPSEIIFESPKIHYAQGELQAFYGFVEQARHSFMHAGNRFSETGERGNACRSLLAESALADREGDEQRAVLSAQSAHTLSGDDPSMKQEQAWASWQLGILASLNGKPGLAKFRFSDACRLTHDAFTRDLFQQAQVLAQELENVSLQQGHHLHEAQLADQTGQEIFRHLLKLLTSPPDKLPDLLELYGWLGIPLALKLPTLFPIPPPNPPNKLLRQMQMGFKAIFSSVREARGTSTLSPLDLLAPLQPAVPESHLTALEASQPAHAAEIQPADAQIMIYCLGALRVLNNRQFVTNWPSHKAQLVFKYLLLHRHTLVNKETIMGVFWPEADIESARRNLHQAIYNLRLTLKSIDDGLNIIEFEQDGYRINPAIHVWVDYVVFEQHYAEAQQKEHAGFKDRAMAEYALAEEMYMDHLFSEDHYEDWMRSQREYLWQIYLSAATRLAEYHFEKGEHALAISIGQRILQKDPCEESAHQILMRCFHSQGQRQLAIRQYEICRQALKDELDVETSSRTRQLFAEILND